MKSRILLPPRTLAEAAELAGLTLNELRELIEKEEARPARTFLDGYSYTREEIAEMLMRRGSR